MRELRFAGATGMGYAADVLGKPYLRGAMIVCHCAVVSDRSVTAAVQAGARTLSGVCRSTGAGKNCGACVFSLRRLLCEHAPTDITVSDSPEPEVSVAAS
jgi:bacterioferritin-associated ferredoxin